MTDPISNERLAEMLAGLEGVTPGPWRMVTDYPSISIGAGDYRVVQTANQNNHQRFGTAERWIGIEHETNAAHISRCDPDTIRSLIEEVQASRRQSPTGVKIETLEWKELSTGWIAHTSFHAYEVVKTDQGFMATYANRDFAWGTEDAMKAAAQADYEHRILSCLVSHKPASGDTQDDLPLTDETQEPAVVKPVAWQRRLKYPDVAGAVPQWQSCPEVEATGHFGRSPHHEYRPLYTSPPPKAVTITDEMVERAFQATVPFMAGTAYRELRAALTATLSSEAQP